MTTDQRPPPLLANTPSDGAWGGQTQSGESNGEFECLTGHVGLAALLVHAKSALSACLR